VWSFIATVLLIYLIILACRAVFSWFPVQQGSVFASINAILFDLTEPVLRPFRRIIPPAGMIDLSFMVVFFIVLILYQVASSR
jgi:YggT family protein